MIILIQPKSLTSYVISYPGNLIRKKYLTDRSKRWKELRIVYFQF